MPARDARVDAYIEGAAEFARPILEHLRDVVHEGCPEAEETIKWSFPVFTYRGMLCSMAAHARHCSFGFWKAALVLEGTGDDSGMGNFGRITSLEDLPPRQALVALVRKAARLNEEGVKAPGAGKARAPRPEPAVPDDLAAALAASPAARTTFERFSPSHRREYVEWIADAKREETRRRRIATAVEWMAEGKPRNWKYM